MGSAFENVQATTAYTKTIHTDTYDFISSAKADVSGLSVFITGASKGIGRSTALSYAIAGCSKIAIGARSDLSSLAKELKEAAAAAQKREPQIVTLKLDVTSEESVKAAADTVAQEFGGALDVLVNNAGILEDWYPLGESKPSEWWNTWEINVKGTYLCSRYFMSLLLKGNSKTNILTSSIGAVMIAPTASAYQPTKFAICRLAEFIDAEYRDQGLVCLAIHPGGVKTELALNMPKDFYQLLTDEPELCADTIVWLGKERRPWLGGRFLSVAWDMEELESQKDEIVKGDLLKFRLTL